MSVANAINNRGQVVGTSCADPFFDNCRAFLWQDGVMTDLNTLIPTSSSLSLVIANDITDRGEIVGFAVDQNTGDSPGFVAIPCDQQHAPVQGCRQSTVATAPVRSKESRVVLPDNIRETLSKNPFLRFLIRHSNY